MDSVVELQERRLPHPREVRFVRILNLSSERVGIQVLHSDEFAEGIVSRDTLRIGDLEVKDQLSGEGLTVGGIKFAYDGIMGLAYDTLSANHITPPFYSMLDQGLLDAPVFAVYLNNTDSDFGEVTIGGINKSRYTGDMVTIPLKRKSWWEVELDSIILGTKTLELEVSSAILDTGSSWMGMPEDLADDL